jgi:tryptophan synthase alpha chain
MNRIDSLFAKKSKRIVSIYFTAGYPSIDSIVPIINLLEENGADLIEIGMPFSDPLADGPVIQESSRKALENGMSTDCLFERIGNIRSTCRIPLILMGYLNPVIQYGFDQFLVKASACGIDGLILPDLPPEIFQSTYAHIYDKYNIYPVFLVTPQTSDERLLKLDGLSRGFLYAVSSSSTTGKSLEFTDIQKAYFERLASTKLKNPLLIGFGVSNYKNLQTVFSYAQGAVVGSAFIKSLKAEAADYGIPQFMDHLTKNK